MNATNTRSNPLSPRPEMALASEPRPREPRETIDPAVINSSGATQMRAGLNQETVDNYAELMREFKGWGMFPPVAIFHDGTDHWLADGFHRVAAYRQAGFVAPIPATIGNGTRRDAILSAVKANAIHGLPRTNADKRRAVETLLRDEEWGKLSDREIARRCNVNNSFVGDVRRSLSLDDSENSEPAPAPPAERTYITRHGTQATMNTTGQREAAQQRHKPAPAPPAAAPAGSIRPYGDDGFMASYKSERAGTIQANFETEAEATAWLERKAAAVQPAKPAPQTFKADPADPDSANVRRMSFGGALPAKPEFVTVETAFESSFEAIAPASEAKDKAQKKRNERILFMMDCLQASLSIMSEYSTVTGDHTDTIAAERGLRAMMSRLEGNLA